MGTLLAVVYVMGVSGTALMVLRDRIFSQGYVVNTGAIVLWPLYWSYFLASLFLNRTRGGGTK